VKSLHVREHEQEDYNGARELTSMSRTFSFVYRTE